MTNTVEQKHMADDNKEETNKDGTKEEVQDVCKMSVASILTALHQNALANTNAASKGYAIANSAISGDGKKVESAGEHVISLIREDPSKGDTVKKADAVAMLKTYVQWFVGPDLAKEVNDSTVLPLDAPPSQEAKKEDEQPNESVMSFKKYVQLLEAADEDTASDEDDADEGDDADDEDTGDDADDEDTGDDADPGDEGGDGEKLDPKVESNEGYYITYSLKVDGLPQTALKDAMKKFAATFFDDVKIYGTGLFGGSYSFTVKDIKDKFKETFGAIDPNDLVSNVEQKIKKKMPGGGSVDVEVRDKSTLIADLGDQVNAKQKKKINAANYTLWIKVDRTDTKKAFFNPREIADIVTSSIKGLFKKFKNAISKDDVIYIPDYVDEHANERKLGKLYRSIPTKKSIRDLVSGSKPYTTIEKAMDKIENDDEFYNCKRAQAVVNVWKNFRDKSTKSKNEIDAIRDEGARIKQFRDFLDAYNKALDDNADMSLEESSSFTRMDNFIVAAKCLRSTKSLLESMMSDLFEDDENAEEGDEGDEDASGSSTAKPAKGAKLVLSKDACTTIAKRFAQKIAQEFSIAAKDIAIQPDEVELLEPKNFVSVLSRDAAKQLLKDFSKASAVIDDAKVGENAPTTPEDYLIVAMTVAKREEKKEDKKDSALSSTAASSSTSKESLKESLINMFFQPSLINEAVQEVVDSGLASKLLGEADDAGSTSTSSLPADASASAKLPASMAEFKHLVDSIDFAELGIQTSKKGSDEKEKRNGQPLEVSTGDPNATMFIVPFTIRQGDQGAEAPKEDLSGNAKIKGSITGKGDLYLVPMPGLKYKDDEV